MKKPLDEKKSEKKTVKQSDREKLDDKFGLKNKSKLN